MFSIQNKKLMSNYTTTSTSINSLYILKCVCAILVVFIHLPGLSCEAMVLQPLMRIGVPSFLMISGYFLFSNGKLDSLSIRKQIKKLIKLMLVVYSVYLSFFFINRACMGMPLIPDHWSNFRFWIRLLFVGDGIDSILWYLTSYLEALAILYLLSKLSSDRRMGKLLFISAPVFLCIAVLFNRYSFVISCNEAFDIALSRNAITVALPCLVLGGGIKHIQDIVSKRFSVCIMLTYVILAYFEYGLLHHYGAKGSGADFNLMTFPCTASVFLFCLKYPETPFIPAIVKQTMISIGKYHSGNIYLYHSLMYHLVLLMVFYGVPIVWMQNAECVITLVVIFSICQTYLINKTWIHPKSNL